MNQFLRNIIYRHQASGSNLETSYIVQPRPTSRFETDASTGESLTQHEPDIEPATKTARTPSADSQMTPQQQTGTAIGHATDDKNELINTPVPLPGHRLFVQETPGITTQDKDDQQSKKQTEPTSETKQKEQENKQNLLISDELNPRIQTILHRLNSQHTQRDNTPLSAESRQGSALSNTPADIDKNTLAEPAELPFFSEQARNVETEDNGGKHNSENQPQQRATHQDSLLQTPDWLTDVQSNLNNRQQASHAPAKPEPVVNVSIGRVEIRAVQTEPPIPSKARNKPSGIMSLDDYLEQRNKGQS